MNKCMKEPRQLKKEPINVKKSGLERIDAE